MTTTLAPFPPSATAFPTSDVFWIGHRLLNEHKITEEEFAGAISRYRSSTPRMPFPAVLEELGLVTPSRVAAMMAAAHQMQLVELNGKTVQKEVARSIPEAKARDKLILPFSRSGNSLSIAVFNPSGYNGAHAKADFPGYTVKFAVAARSDILAAIAEAHRSDVRSTDPQTVFEEFLKRACAAGASDLHMEPKEKGVQVRLRVDNRLIHEEYLDAAQRDPLLQAAKLFGRMDISEKRVPQDGRGKVVVGSRQFSVRLSTVPCMHGESVVARLIDENAGVRSFADIGLLKAEAARLQQLIDRPDGIIYVTGPTGSGKTTLLYSALNQLPAADLKIITVEDPIEYVFPQFVQIPIDEKLGRTFAKTLPFVLRQDPDVVLIGETRDFDTAQITVRASLTGHLCFSTLHTNDAVSAVTRLVDLGIERFLVASALKGVVAQRLVRRLCPHCRVAHKMNDALLATHRPILEAADVGGDFAFYAAAIGSCPHCRGSGYRHRIAVLEVFSFDKLEREISSGSEEDLRAIMRQRGFRTMREDGVVKAALGLTTLEEVFSVV